MAGSHGAAVTALPPEDGSRTDEASSGEPAEAPPTREVPVTPRPAVAPAVELPLLTQDLPVPGRGPADAASDLHGPWDEAVAPFTVPPTRLDRRLPREGAAASGPPAEPLPPGARPWTPGPPPSHPSFPGVRGAWDGSDTPPPGGWSRPELTGGPPGNGPAAPGTSRRMPAAFVAAGAAVLVTVAVVLVFGRLGGDHRPRARCAGEACARQTKSAVSPRFRYRTVEQDTGYFEGTVTIVNRGRTPLRSWTLTFTYPGADIHNAWEVLLRQKGENVTIVSEPTADPIAPGHDFEVRFGGSGRPGMPTNCRLDGAPCEFVR